MCIRPDTLTVSLIGLLNDCALIQKQVFLILCNLLELLCILYSVWQLLLCMCSYSLYTHLNSFAVAPACISLTDKPYFFLFFVMSLYFSCSLGLKGFFYKLFLYWPSAFVRTISLTVAAYKPHGINPFFHTWKQIEVTSEASIKQGWACTFKENADLKDVGMPSWRSPAFPQTTFFFTSSLSH